MSDTTMLKGKVEMDEMYLGGKETNKHESKKVQDTQGRSTKTKAPIFGMIEHYICSENLSIRKCYKR